METREALEPFCAELAARKRTDDDLAVLDRANDDIADPDADLSAFLQANLDWHVGVAMASHNELLIGFMTALSHAIYSGTDNAAFVDDRRAGCHRARTPVDHERDPQPATPTPPAGACAAMCTATPRPHWPWMSVRRSQSTTDALRVSSSSTDVLLARTRVAGSGRQRRGFRRQSGPPGSMPSAVGRIARRMILADRVLGSASTRHTKIADVVVVTARQEAQGAVRFSRQPRQH